MKKSDIKNIEIKMVDQYVSFGTSESQNVYIIKMNF